MLGKHTLEQHLQFNATCAAGIFVKAAISGFNALAAGNSRATHAVTLSETQQHHYVKDASTIASTYALFEATEALMAIQR